MFCPKCGSNVPDSTKFCPTCGALLADEAQQAPATEPQPQPQGFGGDVNENKRNYCRAKLVWLLIGIAVTVIFTIIAMAGGGLAALIYEQY